MGQEDMAKAWRIWRIHHLQIHQGHVRVQSCLKRARRLVFWIEMAKKITDFVLNCKICQHKSKSKPREPISERPIPELPFEEVFTDLFNFEDEYYVVLIDNYSGFIEYDRL
jgi:hypothetical protein